MFDLSKNPPTYQKKRGEKQKMPELYQGKNTSIEINSTQENCIQELEWENLGIATVLTRALSKAVKFERIQKEKKEEIREIERKFDL